MAWLGWGLVTLGLVVWAVGARGFVDELAEFLRGRRPGPPDDDQGGDAAWRGQTEFQVNLKLGLTPEVDETRSDPGGPRRSRPRKQPVDPKAILRDDRPASGGEPIGPDRRWKYLGYFQEVIALPLGG